MGNLTIDLGDRSYPIEIGHGILRRDGGLKSCLPQGKAFIVSNHTVAPLYLEQLKTAFGGADLHEYLIPDGERYKTLATWSGILDDMLGIPCDRDTPVVALGGGVVGDIAGFAAASYQRGVPYIQVPTTLLAQVDSSVGGKTGVNHPAGKNMIGAFYQPRCVVTDIATLETLPDRELKAGLAEVIKYGLIRDAGFFAWLEDNMTGLLRRAPAVLTSAITRSCENKAAVVAADERESGVRAILNLGHTFGHAIEAGLGYGEWLHGEAVAAGMMMAARLSAMRGWLRQDEVDRIGRLLQIAGLPLQPPDLDSAIWLQQMGIDKKVKDGRIRLVLLKSIGTALIVDDFIPEEMDALLARTHT